MLILPFWMTIKLVVLSFFLFFFCLSSSSSFLSQFTLFSIPILFFNYCEK